MLVYQPDIKLQARFTAYSHGILSGECGQDNIDHAIMYIGYGYFKGTPVWVLRNSWGSNWGKEGIFYTEIGKNSYCSEMEAMANIPFTETKESLVEEKWFQFEEQFWLERVYHLRRGYEGLDFDDGVFYTEPTGGNGIFIVSCGAMIVAWILIQVGICIFKKCKEKKKQAEKFQKRYDEMAEDLIE